MARTGSLAMIYYFRTGSHVELLLRNGRMQHVLQLYCQGLGRADHMKYLVICGYALHPAWVNGLVEAGSFHRGFLHLAAWGRNFYRPIAIPSALFHFHFVDIALHDIDQHGCTALVLHHTMAIPTAPSYLDDQGFRGTPNVLSEWLVRT